MAKWLAGVAELADALDLGSSVPDVQVQVLSPAVGRNIGNGVPFFDGHFSRMHHNPPLASGAPLLIHPVDSLLSTFFCEWKSGGNFLIVGSG